MIPICDGKNQWDIHGCPLGRPVLPSKLESAFLRWWLNKAAEQGRLGLPQNTEYLKISWLIMVNYRFPHENEAFWGVFPLFWTNLGLSKVYPFREGKNERLEQKLHIDDKTVCADRKHENIWFLIYLYINLLGSSTKVPGKKPLSWRRWELVTWEVDVSMGTFL